MCIIFRFILDKMVRAVTDGRAGSKMPGKVESYVAYLDLCYIVGANASDSHRSGEDVEGGEGAAGVRVHRSILSRSGCTPPCRASYRSRAFLSAD